MAARDILALNTSMASRLIRCLYIVALILIAVMVVLGLWRGVRVMSFSPPARPAVSSAQQPSATPAQPAPRPGMMSPARRQAMRQMMARRFERRRGPFGMGLLPRSPILAGLIIILGTLLRGAIILLVVRILAEIGLAILAMPRRSET